MKKIEKFVRQNKEGRKGAKEKIASDAIFQSILIYESAEIASGKKILRTSTSLIRKKS